MIDVRATREAYDTEVIDNLVWIRRVFNLADPLTKLDNRDMMKMFMESGQIEYEVEKYVVRTPTQ